MQNNKGGDEEKAEPKENDKWVENNEKDAAETELSPKSNASRRLDELRGRAKQFASNKFHLIIVLLCIILFILFLIVITLAVQLGNYKCPESAECRTADCLSSAAAVVLRSDKSFKPCDDFWRYSCNGWTSRNVLPDNRGSYSITDQLKNQINNRVRHLIDLVPYNVDTTTHQSKVKNFYTACMALKDVDYWFAPKIKDAIHEIGGWAMIEDAPGADWSRKDVLKKLHVTFGVSAFFKVLVEPDDADPVRNIIKLVPSGLGLPNPRYYFKPLDDPYVKAYKDFIKNTMQEMGVKLREANEFAQEVFHYEKRLAEVTPSPEVLRNMKDHYVIMNVNRLDQLSSSISWSNLLQTYFPGIIHSETQVAVLSKEYFEDVSAIISSTDNSVLNNYYMWRLMHTYVPHSSSQYRHVANHLKQTFEGVSNLNKKHEEDWEFCLGVTSQILGHAVGAMYVDNYFPQKSQEQVSVYLHKLVGALSGIAKEIPWLEDSDTQDSAHNKIRSLLLLIGHPGFAKNRTLDTYYKELRVEANHFQNLKQGVYFFHKKQEEMLKKSALADYGWTIYPHNVFADYKYPGNQLVVPAGLFESPLFDLNAPLAVKYGVLAAHVANKMSDIFDDKGVNYDIYGSLKPWMTNRSMESFKRKEDCLKTAVANFSLHGVVAEPDLTVGSLIADIGGVKVAYEAYKRHSGPSRSEGELPGMNINNDQLFFLSYAQSLCEIVRPEKLRAARDASASLPEELRVLGTLQQLREFSTAFSCPKGSSLNPPGRCHMW